ncbi:hypothetical protein MGG_16819, partial [Pyricularia oryzae 70-15]
MNLPTYDWSRRQNGPPSFHKFSLDPTFRYLTTQSNLSRLEYCCTAKPSRQSRSLSRWKSLLACLATNPAPCL